MPYFNFYSAELLLTGYLFTVGKKFSHYVLWTTKTISTLFTLI